MADANRDPLASSSGSALGWFEEVFPTVVPPAPVVTTSFRRTGGGFELTKDAYDSAEIRNDRMTADSRHGVRRAEGRIQTELSCQSFDTMWEALMGARFQPSFELDGGGVDFASISTNQSTNRIVFAGLVGAGHGFQFADRIRITGASEAALNADWTVIAADATTVTVSEPLPLSAADAGAGVKAARLGRRLVIGNVYRTFGFEETLSEVAQFQLFSGVKANTAALNLPPTGIATCEWGFLGQRAGPMGDSSISGKPPAEFDQTDFGALTFNGGAQTISAEAGDFAVHLEPGDRIRFFDITQQHERKILTVLKVATRQLTVGESLESDTITTYTMRRVATADYEDSPATSVLAAADGFLMLDGAPIATVTALNFTIDNGIAGAAVVGSNELPQLVWGPRQSISGQLTALFQEGGVYNKFEGEIEGNLIMRLDDPQGGWMQFAIPRAKFNSATLDRAAAEGVPVQVAIVGLRSFRVDCEATPLIITAS